MSWRPIRDTLSCLGDVGACVVNTVPPIAWWSIGGFALIIVGGLLYKAGRFAYRAAGPAGLIGALGIIGTLAIVILQAVQKARSGQPSSPVDGRDTEPEETPVAPKRRARRPLRDLFNKDS